MSADRRPVRRVGATTASLARRLTRRGRALRRALVVLALGAAGAAALALGAAWLNVPGDPLPARADAIVVLAGDHEARVLEAVRLYQAGLADAVWITGDVPPPGETVSLAEAWRLIGRLNGLPEERVTLLASRTTWEDGRAVAGAAGGRRSLVVISSWYHLRRARCVFARQLGPEGPQVAFVAAAGLPHAYERWWREPAGWMLVPRELGAHGYYWLRYGLNPWRCAS